MAVFAVHSWRMKLEGVNRFMPYILIFMTEYVKMLWMGWYVTIIQMVLYILHYFIIEWTVVIYRILCPDLHSNIDICSLYVMLLKTYRWNRFR